MENAHGSGSESEKEEIEEDEEELDHKSIENEKVRSVQREERICAFTRLKESETPKVRDRIEAARFTCSRDTHSSRTSLYVTSSLECIIKVYIYSRLIVNRRKDVVNYEREEERKLCRVFVCYICTCRWHTSTLCIFCFALSLSLSRLCIYYAGAGARM